MTDGELSRPPGCEPGPRMPGGTLCLPSLQLARPRSLRVRSQGVWLPGQGGRLSSGFGLHQFGEPKSIQVLKIYEDLALGTPSPP